MKKYISLSMVFAVLLALGNLFMAPGTARADLLDTTYQPNAVQQSQGILGVDAFGNTTAEDPNVDYGQNKGSTVKSGGSSGGGGNIFSIVTGKAAKALAGVKKVVYVLAGFGLIAFAFMAIFNKISWKWFANIAIGLFLVASMGIFIDYFVTPGGGANGSQAGGYKLAYGSYLSSAFDDIQGSSGDSFGGASDESLNTIDNSPIASAGSEFAPVTPGSGGNANSGGIANSGGSADFGGIANAELNPGLAGITTPGIGVGENSANGTNGEDGKAGKQKRGIKGALSDAKNMIKTGVEIKQGVDNAVNTYKTVKNEYDRVANAIQSNGGGIGGILSSVQDVSQGLQNTSDATMSGVKNINANISNAANTTQNVGKTAEEIKQLEYKRQNKEGTNKVSEWLSSDGAGGSMIDAVEVYKEHYVDNTVENTQNAAARGQEGVAMVEKGGVGGKLGLVAGIGAGVAMGGSELFSSSKKDFENKQEKNQPVLMDTVLDDTPTTRSGGGSQVNQWMNGGTPQTTNSNDGGTESINNNEETTLKGDSEEAEIKADLQERSSQMDADMNSQIEARRNAYIENTNSEEMTMEQMLAEDERLRKERRAREEREYILASNLADDRITDEERQQYAQQQQAKKEQEEARKKEMDTKCPDGQKFLTINPQTGKIICGDTQETAQKKKEEAQQKKAEEQKNKAACEAREGYAWNSRTQQCVKTQTQKNKENPEIANQIKALEEKSEKEQDACWEQYDAMRASCEGLQNPEYTNCVLRSEAKQDECNKIPNKYQSQILTLKAKMG